MCDPTPMSRLVFARCAGLIARRATQWSHEVLCEVGTLDRPVNPDAAQRFCAEIADVLKQVEVRTEITMKECDWGKSSQRAGQCVICGAVWQDHKKPVTCLGR